MLMTSAMVLCYIYKYFSSFFRQMMKITRTSFFDLFKITKGRCTNLFCFQVTSIDVKGQGLGGKTLNITNFVIQEQKLGTLPFSVKRALEKWPAFMFFKFVFIKMHNFKDRPYAYDDKEEEIDFSPSTLGTPISLVTFNRKEESLKNS